MGYPRELLPPGLHPLPAPVAATFATVPLLRQVPLAKRPAWEHQGTTTTTATATCCCAPHSAEGSQHPLRPPDNTPGPPLAPFAMPRPNHHHYYHRQPAYQVSDPMVGLLSIKGAADYTAVQPQDRLGWKLDKKQHKQT